MIFLGLIYGWSVFVNPLEAEFGWSRADTSLIFTISMITFCVGNIAGGWFNRKFCGNWILLFAAVLELLGFFLCAYVTQLYEIYFLYGVICGMATGLAYNTVVSMVTSWFPQATGMVSGILMMGYGLGALILGSIVTILINTLGWRFAFRMLAFLFAAVIGSAALIIRSYKKVEQTGKEQSHLKKSYTPIEMMCTPIFWEVYLWAFLICAIGMNVIGNVAPCSRKFGASDMGAVFAVGCVSVTNGAGRILYGIMFDKLGKMKTLQIDNMAAIAGSVLLAVGAWTEKLSILMIGFVFIGFAYAALAPYSPVFAKDLFGEAYYTTNFSIMASTGIPASVVGSYVMGFVITKTDSYTIGFGISILLALVAYLVKLDIRKRIRY